MKNKGFTLLELLVVVGIIGVLVSLVAVSYSAAQKRSRDSRRKVDLRSMRSALEQYYTETTSPNFVYPALNCSDGLAYLKGSWPVDPVNSGSLQYSNNCDVNSFYICAELEVAGSGNASSPAGDSDGTGLSWGAGDYYCVSNLQ